MTKDVKSASGSPDSAGSAPAQTRKHFDTFETRFFDQGDDSGKPSVEADQWGDLDEKPARRFVPSRQLVVAVAIGSAGLAALGCVALWRSGGRAPDRATVAVAEPAKVSPAAVASAPAPPTPPVIAPAAAQPTAPPAVLAVPAAAPAAPEPAAAAPAEEAVRAREICVQAIQKKRGKDILAACAQAFEADPSSAEPAVALARVEFERGHTAQALAWGKQAIAVDPDAADAYVFIGGAEQNAGHGKAAKEAYRRYLQLAPRGRYAADLRAIVGRP